MMRKRFLWLLSTVGVLSPSIMLVACSEPTKIKKDKSPIIDLAKITSVEHLLSEFNHLTNVFMPKPAHELAKLNAKARASDPFISETSFVDLKKYTNDINFISSTINFRFGDQQFIADLSPIKKEVAIIKTKLALGYDKVLNSNQVMKIMTKTNSAAASPNMPAILNNLLDASFSTFMMGYMAIPSNGFENYLVMMEAYHDFAYALSQSAAYNDWINQLPLQSQYKLVVGQGEKDYPDREYKIIYVKPGQKYEQDRAVIKENIELPFPSKPQELNNLEAQLVLSLSNLYSLANTK